MHTKLPETPWSIWVSILCMTLVLVWLCRLSRWCYFFAVPIALIAVVRGWGTLAQNASFREAMIQQLGYSYYTQYACSFAVPIVVLAVYAFYDFRCRRRRVARSGSIDAATVTGCDFKNDYAQTKKEATSEKLRGDA